MSNTNVHDLSRNVVFVRNGVKKTIMIHPGTTEDQLRNDVNILFGLPTGSQSILMNISTEIHIAGFSVAVLLANSDPNARYEVIIREDQQRNHH